MIALQRIGAPVVRCDAPNWAQTSLTIESRKLQGAVRESSPDP